MGTEAHLISVGAPASALDRAVERLRELEDRWSRFCPDSEISRLNAAGGEPVTLSAETAAAIACAVGAWERTAGLFDPTVGSAMRRIGYDRSFDAINVTAGETTPGAAPGCSGVVVDRDNNLVRLPPAVELDLGGIGKGLAADWLVAQLLADGAEGASVNIGGDVRVAGDSATEDGWVVAIEHPAIGEVGRVSLDDGAVATSSTCKRRWQSGARTRHHIVDPRIGEPAETDLAGVTVIAGTAAHAEVLCKALMLGPPEARVAEVVANRAVAVLVAHDGEPTWVTEDGWPA